MRCDVQRAPIMIELRKEEPRMATIYHPGDMHDHKPAKQWSKIKANPNSPGAPFAVTAAMKVCFTPNEIAAAARNTQFGDKPIARQHLDWYLTFGKGRDFIEDKNIDAMLRTDVGVRAAVKGALPAGPLPAKFVGSLKLDQEDYTGQDFRFAFGTIDIFDFEIDTVA